MRTRERIPIVCRAGSYNVGYQSNKFLLLAGKKPLEYRFKTREDAKNASSCLESITKLKQLRAEIANEKGVLSTSMIKSRDTKARKAIAEAEAQLLEFIS